MIPGFRVVGKSPFSMGNTSLFMLDFPASHVSFLGVISILLDFVGSFLHRFQEISNTSAGSSRNKTFLAAAKPVPALATTTSTRPKPSALAASLRSSAKWAPEFSSTWSWCLVGFLLFRNPGTFKRGTTHYTPRKINGWNPKKCRFCSDVFSFWNGIFR